MTAYTDLKPCSRCLTPMRSRRKKPTDYPFKTLCAGKDGLCHSCTQRDRRGTTNQAPKAPEPEPLTAIDPDNPPSEITVKGYIRWRTERQHRIKGQVMPSR